MKHLIIFFCLAISFKSFGASHKFEKVKVTGRKTDFLQLNNINGESLSQEFLKDHNLLHFEEALQLSSNVNFAGGSNRLRYIQIRGIGERSEFDSVPSTSVGFYYDHIDLSGIGGISSNFDTKSIQILKGPQSYFYGDSSIAGNVLIKSSNPFDHIKKVSVRAGSQAQRALTAQINHQVLENLSFKIGAEKNKSNGFYKNTFLNKNTSNRDELFINSGTSIKFGEIEIESRHIFADFKNGYDVWNAYENNFKTFTDNPGSDEQRASGHSLELSVPLKNHHLEITASHLNSDSYYSYDEDWGNNNFWQNLAGYNSDYDYYKSFKRKNKNQHLKALYQIQSNYGVFNIGTHIYQRALESDIQSFKDSTLRSQIKSDYKSTHFAGFISYKKNLFKDLSVHLNTRLESQKIDYFDSLSFKDSTKNTLSSQNLEFLYTPNTRNSVKLIFSKGFSGAGVNPDLNLTPSQRRFSPETALNYEASWNRTSSWFDHKVNLFYTKRNNQQIKTSAQNDPLNPSEFTIYTDNASKSENFGLEFSGLIAPLSPLNLQVSLGLLKGRFISYEREGVSYHGRDLAHAPNHQLSVFLNYQINKKIKITLSSLTKDSFYFSNSHNQKSKSYSIVNANAKLRVNKHMHLSMWVKNILNKRYAIKGFYFPNRPPEWSTELYTQQGAPREWGAQLNIIF